MVRGDGGRGTGDGRLGTLNSTLVLQSFTDSVPKVRRNTQLSLYYRGR